MRFKILAGRHQTGHGRFDSDTLQHYAAYNNGQPRLDAEGNPLPDEIETDRDLVKLFGRQKFERLDKPSTEKGN